MLRKKNLVNVIILLEPSTSVEGYESKYLPLLLKYMDPNDYDITIIGSKLGSNCFPNRGIKYRSISLGPKTTSGISLVVGYALYLIVAFFSLFKETRRKEGQVLMSLGGHTYSGIIVTLSSKLLNKKSIVRFAGPTRKTVRLRYKFGFLYSSIAKIIEKWVFSNCDVLISNSPISNYVGDNEIQSIIISQGIDLERFHPSLGRLDHNDFPRLVTVARLSKEKRIENIIKSLPLLLGRYQNIRLDIVGEGPERETLESISFKLGLKNRVKFHGYIKQVDIPSILSTSDLFILPSATESLPSAMLEAMACKIPVIVSESWIDNLNDFEMGINVMSCDGSVESIMESVIKLLNDKSLRQRLVENAYNTIIQYHNSSDTRLKFRNVVDNLTKGTKK